MAATVAFLAPGFVALKVFYVFGLRTKRSDAQWAIWSLLASVPIEAMAATIHRRDDGVHLGVAIGIAIALGSAASLLWTLVSGWDGLRARTAVRIWDHVLTTPCWVQVWTKDGRIFFGWAQRVALSTETDDLDVYLDRASVVAATGEEVVVPGLKGVLIARSEIHQIALLDGRAQPAPTAI
jgi:hypothetical protein